MREKTVEEKIKDWFKTQGVRCWKYHGGSFSVTSHPDLYGFIPLTKQGDHARAFFIEVKAPSKEITRAQALWLEDVYEDNAIAFCAKSLDDVKIVFAEFIDFV